MSLVKKQLHTLGLLLFKVVRSYGMYVAIFLLACYAISSVPGFLDSQNEVKKAKAEQNEAKKEYDKKLAELKLYNDEDYKTIIARSRHKLAFADEMPILVVDLNTVANDEDDNDSDHQSSKSEQISSLEKPWYLKIAETVSEVDQNTKREDFIHKTVNTKKK